MRSGPPTALASVLALAITNVGALALGNAPPVAVSEAGDRVAGGIEGSGHVRTADSRIQCNDGWVFDVRKQFCVRTHAPARTAPRSLAPRATSPRASAPTKRRLPEVAGIRTLCVRQCDGYYFPISYSATRKRFKIDEAVCKAMYGGATADLYFHHNGSPADTAVSLAGKPLAKEPNAFAFRLAFSESCHAELKGGLTRLVAVFMEKAKGSPSPGKDQAQATRLVPVPSPRVIAGTDPETLSNRAGGLNPAAIRSRWEASTLAASNIRKLGPGYYYADPLVITRLRDPPLRRPEFTLIGSALAHQSDGE